MGEIWGLCGLDPHRKFLENWKDKENVGDRRREEDNTETHLKVTWLEDTKLIEVAQHRDHWPAVVNMMINLLLSFISVAWDSWDSARWDLICSGNIIGPIPAPAVTSPLRPKIHVWLILVILWPISEWCHEFITLCRHFMFDHGKWNRPHLYYVVVIYLSELTREVSINKFEVHNFQIHLWDLRYLYA